MDISVISGLLVEAVRKWTYHASMAKVVLRDWREL